MWRKIWWKELAIAGLAGCACNYMHKHLKEHQKVVLPIVQGSIAAGLVGTGVGLAAASYRKLPVYVNATSVGINFTIATAAFLGIRKGIVYVHRGALGEKNQTATGGSYDYLTSCISGGVTGTLLSVLSRLGLTSILGYSVGGVAVGITGQFIYLRFETWRQKRAIKLYYPELAPPQNNQWTMDRFFRFMTKTSKLAAARTELNELEDLVEMEKARITELDRLLTASSNDDMNDA